jgi:RHS repeat-associated protein
MQVRLLTTKKYSMISLISGESVLHEEDFRLNGPIPLMWTRNYLTHVPRKTMLGETWHLNFDQSIRVDRKAYSFFWENANGNIVELPYLQIEETAVITEEKIKYTHLEGKKILIENYDEKLSYYFEYAGGAQDTYRLTKITRHRFEINLSYNVSGRLEQIIDSSNRTLKVERDSAQRISSVIQISLTENDKNLVSYEYDEEGYLSIVCDALGQEEQFAYTNGLLTLRTDRNGETQHWEYENVKEDPKCLRRWFTKSGKQLESFAYKLGHTIVTNAEGGKTTHWHKNGEIIQVTDPLGNSEVWEYNLNGLVMRYTDKLGLNTYYGYDDYGNQTSVRLPNGGTTSYIFEDNNLVMAKNAKDAVWIWQYDENGFLNVRIGPSKDITRYEYKDDLLSKVIDANGLETHLTYNQENTLEKVALPNGEETNWKYNGQGQLLHAVSNQDTSVNYHYDELGRVKQMKTVDGNMVRLEYDGVGNVIKAKDKHHQVKFGYSATGKLESREENNTEIKFAYSKSDQLKAITNEHKSLYRFDRDKNGQIIQESGFDGLKRLYTRNAGGQVGNTTTPDGRKVNYSYDLLGNVSIVTYDDQTKEVYTYDKGGALIEAVNENGQVRLVRDNVGRVLEEYQNDVRIENTYNRVGQRVALTSNLGADIKISRNKEGQILNTEASQGKAKWEVDITRNLVGLEIERSLPGNVTSSWKRDKNGRPTHHSVSASEQQHTNKQYKWDVNDRLRSIEDKLKNEMVHFEHDVFGNLSAAGYSDGSWDYKLPDEIGNLFKTKEKTDRQYGKAGQLLKDETYSYTYDEVGNLIEKESITDRWRYKWSQSGMLKKVLRPDGNHVDFSYDALGRRLTKTYQEETTNFIWDGNVPLHEWTSTIDGTISSINEKGEKELNVPENLTTWVFEDGTFIPMAKLQDGKSYSIITDHLGTPTEAFDEEGDKVWSRELGIYGQTRNEFGAENFISFTYLGQYQDVETGLSYNRHRYYDPNSGVYISQDPIRLIGGMNIYAYVKDTNSWVDPLGLFDVYRGMIETSDGPFIYSGPVDGNNGLNPANSLGVRPEEVGMSTNTNVDNIQTHRKPPEFGGKQKGSALYKIDTDVLDKHGLEAVYTHDTHWEIRTKQGVDPSELGDRLAKTNGAWTKVCS